MDIEQFDCFKAKVKYHRTDDLKKGAPKNGSIVYIQAVWTAQENEKFATQWIFEVVDSMYWLPECDLELIESIEFKKYSHYQHLNYTIHKTWI